MVHITHSLPNVDSSALLRVCHDGGEPTLHGDGPDEDREEACKHDAQLCGGRIWTRTYIKKTNQKMLLSKLFLFHIAIKFRTSIKCERL